MTEQLSFYNSLPENEKDMLKLAAFMANNITVDDIIELGRTQGKIYAKKSVNELLKKAVENNLLNKEDYWRHTIDISLMINLYPSLKTLKDVKEAKKYTEKNISSLYYYHYQSEKYFVSLLKKCLYALLFENDEEYKKLEKDCYEKQPRLTTQAYSILLQNKDYLPVLSKIDVRIINDVIISNLNSNFSNLNPFSDSLQFAQQFENYFPKKNLTQLPIAYQLLFNGNFSEAAEIFNQEGYETIVYYIFAIQLLTENKLDESLKLFEKGLKLQRRSEKGTYLPNIIHFAFYYLVLLLRMNSEVSMPVLQRIKNSFEKLNQGIALLYRPLIDYSLGQKANLFYYEKELLNYLSSNDIYGLIALPVYFLCNFNLKILSISRLKELVEKAYNAKNIILAYEAAYVLHAIFNNDESGKLYDKIAGELNYKPLLSTIIKTDEWEKTLNILLGLQPAKKTGNANESKSRVVYYFSPKYQTIQPVLQSKQVQGWSKGRNINLKTFFWGGPPSGMTDQDFRIAKTLKQSSSYYHNDYEFKPEVLKELIGHPHIFLNETNDIQIEFIAGKPIIRVEKTDKGYSLKTDLKAPNENDKIFLEKETNTRYKVYELSSRQIEILKILNEEKIVVPEAGKEKLILLLADFSTQGMEVHSDLQASESANITVKDIAADSKIRVQLLPFGDGLKAELFSKPFGDTPPYCKPGKGGKVLLRNSENQVQFQVKRALNIEAENESVLLNAIQSLESLNMQEDLIAFDDPMDSLYLLDVLREHQEICVVEWPEGERYKIRGTAGFGNLSLKLKSNTNWFELKGELKVDEKTVLSLQQLLSLTEKGHGRFIELSSGEFLALSNELRKRLDDLRAFSSTDKTNLKINKFASIALEGLFSNTEDLKADKAWKEFNQRIKDLKTEETPIPATLKAELRPYQEEGFRWMARLAAWEGGACLADDMGLGKTVQTLAVLLHRAKEGPALVVCPVSVIGNWINEARRFSPSLQIKTLGIANRKQTLDELQAGDLLVTSYGLLQSEEELFKEPDFATVVLDEAHTIKNYATKTSKATMQLKASFRIALTGTPIQNHLGEIWNLFNFINPGLLGNLSQFSDRFIKPDEERVKKQLKKLISPFILRRTKSNVLDELPAKTEIVKKIRLSDDEMAFYEALRRTALENISNDDTNNGAKHLQVLAEITKLRQACCNPLLIDKNINISSSKLSTFIEIMNELLENKHRALVFSQFVTHLTIVREALDKLNISYQYLDGSTPVAEREKRVRKFQEGEGELFLISLKAGGLGLNLTAADYVIHLDPWWNPAVEDQASDRAHRIGQTRPVTIYRLVAENTIEEKIIELHNTKRNLAESLLEGSDQSARLSIKELMGLIRENQ